ncbi:MAG: Phage Tail Collar Domain protein [Alphaproteobacteria bacterium ADurb.Bin438]|nr:MAG: Phage Tail Collar Domain protein [Alphaproteobacteria bacterium ADurb.Bin438]
MEKMTTPYTFVKGAGVNCNKINANFDIIETKINEASTELDMKANTSLNNLDDEALYAFMPAGLVIAGAFNIAPDKSRLLLCNGAEISRAVYSKLFSAIGTTFGVGDNATTFNIPDYRGKFLRGMGGNSISNMSETQNDAIRNITGGGFGGGHGGATLNGAFYKSDNTINAAHGGGYNNYGILYFDASKVVPTANENRPINQAINFFIKY